ncbi:hypothetical protein FE257_009418 [Aspergillus nanangensis]|uniref:FAD-binding domain-containing protein n=1 Tax=Aspergillus nanangensis TaxID=2582783 RepID=A0AAD4GU20_ASPNN|nr:hypothetical protein FE257_009418 [Aspergillus nanangensis]
MNPPESNFRVIIVGGSIAGLTLAHCLARNHIDFVVLEAHGDIAPQVGASIGVLPNGARILDQLGIYDDVLAAVEPLVRSYTWTDAGKCITDTDGPVVSHERHGYPTAFLDRQILLGLLYAHLGDQQKHILVNKKVTQVDHLPHKVIVHCADQATFEGDLIVGADGVHSTVRQQMWSYMESSASASLPGLAKEALEERHRMTAEYNCVFGISTATPGLTPGHVHRTFAEGYSLLTIVGKEGRVFWFFFTRMRQRSSAGRIPRYKPEEIDAHVAPFLQKPITAEVAFADVHERAIVRTLVPLEEANYAHWGVDRYVCIGDAAHKMTPNLGQGGNSAIESAASLANSLSQLLVSETATPIPVHHIHRCIQAWQKPRQQRVKTIWQSAHDLTRLEALVGLKEKLIGLYLLPHLTGYLLDKMSATIVGAAKLDCEPLPLKSVECSMAYTDESSQAAGGEEEPLWKRGLETLPLLGCYAVAHVTMGTLVSRLRPLMVPYLMQGTWTAGHTGDVVHLRNPVYHVPFLDNLFRPLILCFLPSISGSDGQSRLQMMSFMADLAPMYGIWLLESLRQSHPWQEILLPLSTGIAFQLKGIGKVAPIYFLLEHIHTPLSKLLSSKHHIAPETSSSLLLAMLTGYYLPTLMNFVAPTLEARRQSNALWQLFPVVVPLLQAPLWILTRRLGAHSEPVTSFADGIARFLQYDEVVSMASGFVWLGLKVRQLKRAGAEVAWWKVVAGAVVTTGVFGPGAALAVGWGWREEVMYCM